MDLSAYLNRIGHRGPVRPDLETLRAVHRAHLLAIPYENLDVQLGRPGGVDPRQAVEKLVDQRRGGWCYEMNGVLGLALEAIGFKVVRMAGAVMREERGAVSLGNHLVLRVELDEGPFIADVGFGDGVLEPIPLAEGDHHVAGYDFQLTRLDDDWWRFRNHPMGGAPYFDFTLAPADPTLLASTCHWLRTSRDSVFTQTTMAMRHRPDGIVVLLGRVLRRVTAEGKTDTLLPTPEAYLAALREEFGLDVPEAAALWPKICAKHEELFAGRPV